MSSSLECPGLGQVKTRPVEPTIYSRQNFADVLRARDRGARANFTILVQCLDPSCLPPAFMPRKMFSEIGWRHTDLKLLARNKR